MGETTPAIRCFVAMAVGRTDTDRIYDDHILPTLRAAGIKAVFMGRLEHNDDINKRIIEEIEKCDFAIADLTYARPSVYFEAGLAERKVPVIYTCCRDHLHPQPDDKFGNLKVHFDLVTRNIISWSDPGDRTLARRLERRVALVTRPILRERQAEAAVKAEEREFERIALTSRLILVSDQLRKVFMRSGYHALLERGQINPWVGRLPRHDTLSLCALYVQRKFSEREIKSHAEKFVAVFRSRFEHVNDKEHQDLYRWRIEWPGYEHPRPGETKEVKKLVARIILCSLEKTPRGRLTAALSRFTADEAQNVFQWDGELPVSGSSTIAGFRSFPFSVSVYMFDPIRSQRDVQASSLELQRVLKFDAASRKEFPAAP